MAKGKGLARTDSEIDPSLARSVFREGFPIMLFFIALRDPKPRVAVMLMIVTCSSKPWVSHINVTPKNCHVTPINRRVDFYSPYDYTPLQEAIILKSVCQIPV